MFFDILLYFPAKSLDPQADFHRSLKSILGQKNTSWKLVVIGNQAQMEASNAVITAIKQSQSWSNQIDLIQIKSYQTPDLNKAFAYLGENGENHETHKLTMLESGDYLSSNFLGDSEDFLQSLELDKEGSLPILAVADFKYIDSKNQVFNSEFILKTKLTGQSIFDYIYKPKLLVHPFQFFWDIDLIKHFELKFDQEIENFDIRLAKFNLDYILALSSLNNFVLPELKINSRAFYICSNLIVEPNQFETKNNWWSILNNKQEQLKQIGGKTWWWYRWLGIWRK